MPDFTDLKIATGVGPVHMNRFTTEIEPSPGRALPTGRELLLGMPGFMDPHTASVVVDTGHQWDGESTLMFRGVVRIQPFAGTGSIPIPAGVLPFGVTTLTLPPSVRSWTAPPIHVDCVGFAATPKANAFTAQTLKREFTTADDKTIEMIVETTVVALLSTSLASNPVTAGLAPLLLIPSIRKAVASPLVAHAVNVNQHHFLAGRRSFRMGKAADFGMPGNNWVFETAAVERFSRKEFEVATNTLMGGAAVTVTPVWVEMGAKIATAFGRQIGSTKPSTAEVATVGDIAGSPFFTSLQKTHSDLVP